jgi:hypothetical protein
MKEETSSSPLKSLVVEGSISETILALKTLWQLLKRILMNLRQTMLISCCFINQIKLVTVTILEHSGLLFRPLSKLIKRELLEFQTTANPRLNAYSKTTSQMTSLFQPLTRSTIMSAWDLIQMVSTCIWSTIKSNSRHTHH